MTNTNMIIAKTERTITVKELIELLSPYSEKLVSITGLEGIQIAVDTNYVIIEHTDCEFCDYPYYTPYIDKAFLDEYYKEKTLHDNESHYND